MVDSILSENKDKWLESMIQVKNRVIGNNKQKDEIIHQGVIPRLLQWIIDEDIPVELRTESALFLAV